MRPNSQYFIVQIDKKAQEKKRSTIPTTKRSHIGMRFIQPEGQKGVIVLSVEEDGPAFQAGFKEKDILLNIDNQEITTPEFLIEYLWQKAPYEKVFLEFISSFYIGNGNQYSTKVITLGAKESVFVYPEEHAGMANNLQYGEIKLIGAAARTEFPYAEIGDILIFNHHVEYKARTTGDKTYEDVHLVGHNGIDELRIVNHEYQVLGVLKVELGEIIPHKNKIFCHEHFKKSSFQMKDGLWLPDGWTQSMDEMQEKIDELKEQISSMHTSTVMQQATTEHNYLKKEEIASSLRRIQKERQEITAMMHKARYYDLTVIFINPETCEAWDEDVMPGDKLLVDYRTLYPLDLGGVHYTIVDFSAAVAIFNNNNEEMKKTKLRPLADRVLLLPDPKEKLTESGIIIPDTAQEKPILGTVIAVGKGKKDEDMELVPGDRVMYSRMTGTELVWEGQDLLMIRQGDIKCAIDEEEEE